MLKMKVTRLMRKLGVAVRMIDCIEAGNNTVLMVSGIDGTTFHNSFDVQQVQAEQKHCEMTT